MDQFSKLRAGVFLIALVSLTACSSSKVDDAATNPPETAGAAANAPDAKTDAVPPVGEDPSLASQSAPGSLDAKGAPQAPDAAAAAAAGGSGTGTGTATAEADAPPPDAGDPAAAAAANADTAATASVTTPPTAEAAPAGDPASAGSPDLASNTVPPPPVSDAPTTASMNLGNDDLIPPPPSDERPSHHSRGSHRSTRTASAEPSGDGVNYTVKRGDTLMKIAFENYGDLYRWKEIYESNRSRIQDPNHVPPGTQLTLNGAGMVTIERNGNQYLIKHGDTLGLISTKVYQTSKKWKKLWENNRQLIKDPNRIYAGFYLYYHPESRMTQGADGNDTSAANSPQNLPFKNQPNAPVKAAANMAVKPMVTAPGSRAPASK